MSNVARGRVELIYEVWSQDPAGSWVMMAEFVGTNPKRFAESLFDNLVRLAPERGHEIRTVERVTRTAKEHRPTGKRRS